MRVEFAVPMATVSTLNRREHWAVRARRVKDERELVAWGWLEHVTAYADRRKKVRPPAIVTLTRRAPRELDDDNLRGALKAVRDQIADQLRVNDRSPRVEWRYAQEKGKPPAVVVLIETAVVWRIE